jgi:hypothetical protein
MNIDDLEYIFKKQIDEGTTKLYFMVVEGNHKEIMRQELSEMSELLPFLDNFMFNGYNPATMPIFIK